MVTNTENPPKKISRKAPTVTSTEEIPDVADVFENVVGCKWTIHVLTQIRQGVRRPGELVRTAEGLSAKVLNERLGKLVRFGVLAKSSYPEIPPRVEYDLTEFGNRIAQILDEVHKLRREMGQA
jgi:DNA-binding HxlR family transcriptional regulator